MSIDDTCFDEAGCQAAALSATACLAFAGGCVVHCSQACLPVCLPAYPPIPAFAPLPRTCVQRGCAVPAGPECATLPPRFCGQVGAGWGGGACFHAGVLGRAWVWVIAPGCWFLGCCQPCCCKLWLAIAPRSGANFPIRLLAPAWPPVPCLPACQSHYFCRCLQAAFEREAEGGKVLGLLKQLADGGEVNQVGFHLVDGVM